MRLSLSIEDTNRLRAKVGLRLIPIDTEAQDNDTSVPSQQIRKVQERILAAEERAEERALHAAAVEGPAIADSGAHSTSAWLEKMRQKRIATNDRKEPENNKPLGRDSQHNPSQTAQTATQSSRRTSNSADVDHLEEEKPLVSNALKPPAAAHNHPPEPVSDPIQAPAEPRKELKRNAELDYEPNKKAVFKPKKLKPSSKARTRSSEIPMATPQLDNEEDALEALLTSSRIEQLNRKKTRASSDEVAYPTQSDDADAHSSALSIGPTQSFLRELQQNTDKGAEEDRTAASELENSEQKQEQQNNTHDNQVNDNDNDNEDESEEPVVTNSVADTLKLLKNEQNLTPSSQSVSKSRREWIQRLTSTRLAKKADISATMGEFKNLPPHERQRAISLYNSEAAYNDARAAKELFKDYTPDVTVEYKDEHGNKIDAKQAFKNLSSAFHGTKGHHKLGRK